MATKAKEKDSETAPAGAETGTKDAAALAAENAELRDRLAAAEDAVAAAHRDRDAAAMMAYEARSALSAGTFSDDERKLVEAKVAAGLTREQAEAVVRAQKEHDARLDDE